MGCVTLFSGDGGLGKGTLMLQLGVAATGGGDWLGRSVKAGPAIIIQAEDDEDEIGRRLRSIAGASGVDLADDLETISQDHLPDDLALFRETDGRLSPTELFRWIELRIQELRPVLFVLDPLADFFEGDHNSRAEVTRFVRHLAHLAARTGTAIVLIDHPSVEGMRSGRGTAGSTGWSFKVRSRLYLSEDKEGLCLAHMKTNYGPKAAPLRLRFDRGWFVARDDDETMLPDRGRLSDPAEAVFLDLLREEIAQGNRLSDRPGKNYAPAVLANRPAANGFTKKRFETVMRRLLDLGVLFIKLAGPETRRRRAINLPSLPTPSISPSNAEIEASIPPTNTPANGVASPSISPANDLPMPFLPSPHTPLAVGNGLGVETPKRSNTRRQEGRR